MRTCIVWLLAAGIGLAQAPADPALPSVFIVGDSTANVSSPPGLQGWGDPVSAYFDPGKVNIVNRARAGRSSRTFQTEGLWNQVLAMLKPGDYVLLQMGHNDGGPPDQDRARGSLPGLGEESQEFTLPNGSHEVVYTFGHYMRKYIAEAKAKGATPIVLSLTVRNIWTDGKVERGSGHFSQWAQEIAKSEGVAFVDLTNIVANEYEKLGEAKVKEFFPGDHTHTNPAGADFNASMVVAGLKGIRSPLAAYLSEKGQAIAPR